MAVETHGVGDRRRHGLGDNVRLKVRVRKAEVKQSLPKSVAATSIPKSPAAVFHTAVSASRAPAKVPTPGKGM